jgi:hypothetical protein
VFLLRPGEEKAMLPFDMRKRIHLVSGFCPCAATTTRSLALHCLTTNRGNILCLYHQKLNKAGRSSDEGQKLQGGKQAKFKFQVTGVPYMRRIADRNQPPLATVPGFLHCGCAEDDALLDFWWFKTGKITSPINGITEGWLTDLLEPRSRAIMANIFREVSGVCIDSLYSEIGDRTVRTPEFLLNRQISILQQKSLSLRQLREHAEAEAEAAARVTSGV